jgi:hypothetical protein
MRHRSKLGKIFAKKGVCGSSVWRDVTTREAALVKDLEGNKGMNFFQKHISPKISPIGSHFWEATACEVNFCFWIFTLSFSWRYRRYGRYTKSGKGLARNV